MKKLIISSFSLLVCLFAFAGVAAAEEVTINEDDVVVKELTDQEAYNNLVESYGYSDTEAYKAVYGTEVSVNNTIASTWYSVTRYEAHAKITGQYKRGSNGWIVDAAPKLVITKRHGVDEIQTIYRNNFRVLDYNRVEMSYKFYWEHWDMANYQQGTTDRVVPFNL